MAQHQPGAAAARVTTPDPHRATCHPEADITPAHRACLMTTDLGGLPASPGDLERQAFLAEITREGGSRAGLAVAIKTGVPAPDLFWTGAYLSDQFSAVDRVAEYLMLSLAVAAAGGAAAAELTRERQDGALVAGAVEPTVAWLLEHGAGALRLVSLRARGAPAESNTATADLLRQAPPDRWQAEFNRKR